MCCSVPLLPISALYAALLRSILKNWSSVSIDWDNFSIAADQVGDVWVSEDVARPDALAQVVDKRCVMSVTHLSILVGADVRAVTTRSNW
jgi:hypothetical protein